MGQGRNGVGDVVAGALAGHGSAGVPPPKKKKNQKKSILGGEKKVSHKIGISEECCGQGLLRGSVSLAGALLHKSD